MTGSNRYSNLLAKLSAVINFLDFTDSEIPFLFTRAWAKAIINIYIKIKWYYVNGMVIKTF